MQLRLHEEQKNIGVQLNMQEKMLESMIGKNILLNIEMLKNLNKLFVV
jgi:hypothetical protein